jgi:hypothetical protein
LVGLCQGAVRGIPEEKCRSLRDDNQRKCWMKIKGGWMKIKAGVG